MRNPVKALIGAAALALVGVALLFLWPAALGGPTTYVVTHGVSMEPNFHTDDLAILRSSSSYEVGDVAGYHGTTVHTLVMHRIVGTAGDSFTFKGDNNSWIDPDHPTANAMVGRLWLRIPQGGKYLRAAHSPWLVGAIGLIVLTLTTEKTRRRRARGRRQAAAAGARRAKAPVEAARSRKARGPVLAPAQRRQIAAGALAVAVAAAAVAAFAFVTPATKTSSSTVTVTHTPTFSYAATMSAGVTYPDGAAQTGQPLYTALLRRLTVTVRDSVAASDGSNAGRPAASIDVTLENASGWSTTVTSVPSAPVPADGITVPIDVPALTGKLAAVARETGAAGSDGTVTIRAHLTSTGVVASRPTTAVSDASYALAVSSLQVRPAVLPAAAAPAPAAGATDAATPAKTTSVTVPIAVPRTWSLAKVTVPVRSVRLPSAGLALAALVVALCCGAASRGREHPAVGALAVIGARRVDVAELSLAASVVDVTSVEALVRVADRYDRLILCQLAPGGSTFVVNDDGTSYRLVVPATGARHLRVA
jgi:signal peptidase I